MFWGLIMEPRRRYMQEITQSFHISMAALDVFACTDEPSQILLHYNNKNYLLCTLQKENIIQCPLDLNFEAGDVIAFATNGNSNVHLTGYVVEEDRCDSSEDDDEVVEKDIKRKKKISNQNTPKKKSKIEQLLDEEYDSNDDESFSLSKYLNEEEEESDADDMDQAEEDDEEAENEEVDDDDDDDDDEGGEEESDGASSLSENEEQKVELKINGKQKKKKKKAEAEQNDLRPSSGGSKQTPIKHEKTPIKREESPKKENKTPKQGKTPKENKTPKQKSDTKSPSQQNQSPQQKRTVEGGIVIQDLKVGEGQVAKPGKMIQVYYEGKLKQNNKVFDKVLQGQGFKFRLGKREVIKGWDIGVNGMKVGGKRRIVCPASMAYGEKGSPPQIPPNSTLIFEVELKGVK